MGVCGHKHVSDFNTRPYGDYFDRRSLGRYILNLFRRRLGANTLPYQFRDVDGKHISNYINRLIELIALKIKSEGTDEETFIDALMAVLKNSIDHPIQFGVKLEEFIKEYKLSGKDIIDDDDVQEIQTRISSQLTKSEREILAATGLTYITRIAKGIRNRPFLQSMCGSSAKASLLDDVARSFNVYVLGSDGNTYNVKRTRFKLKRNGNIEESVNEFTFSNHDHVMLRGH